MPLQLRYASHSEIGLVRKNNQDSGFVSPHLLVVADGMGGAAAGDLASAVAIDTIRRIDGPADGEQMLEVLAGAIHKANDRIADLVEADLNLDGMGTTVTGAMFDGAELGLAHIGDSRAYLLRDGRLEQLTHDHSWVQSLVDEGKISESEAAIHPHRSLLLKVLNGQPANDPDLTMVRVQAGDRLMFCSDGLCGLVADPEIETALQIDDLDESLAELVAQALAEGGIDNITVIVADVVDAVGSADPVVLGAAAERDIPVSETRLRDDTMESDEPVVVEEPDPAGEIPPDDEERYTPQAPHARRLRRPLLIALVVLLIVGAGLASAYAWTRTQYYVGAAGEQVAIYQGLADGVPGVPLAKLYEVQKLTVTELPPYYQEKVRSNIEVSSLTSARETVAELTEAARRCSSQGNPSPSPSPTATPTAVAEPNC
jgi:serine/threonine protein phosphatase PrpC